MSVIFIRYNYEVQMLQIINIINNGWSFEKIVMERFFFSHGLSTFPTCCLPTHFVTLDSKSTEFHICHFLYPGLSQMLLIHHLWKCIFLFFFFCLSSVQLLNANYPRYAGLSKGDIFLDTWYACHHIFFLFACVLCTVASK